jgi:hypothetical protein
LETTGNTRELPFPYKNPLIIPVQDPKDTQGESSWSKQSNAPAKTLFSNLLEKIPLRNGERIRGTIEKKLNFEPIRLKKKLTSERISALRAESWTSSTHTRIF